MITTIIDSLTTDTEISNALLKTLVLARRIGNEALERWVRNELNGYEEGPNNVLPSYRFAKTVNRAVLQQNGLTRNAEDPLPLSCFREETMKFLMSKKLTDSVATYQEILRKPENQYIIQQFPAGLLHSLNAELKSNGYTFKILTCRQIVAISELSTVLISVKSKLLDLLLNLEGKIDTHLLGSSPSPEVKSKLNPIINISLADIYNITTNGNDNIINAGDQNSIGVKDKQQSKLELLLESLTNAGLRGKDVSDVKEILINDSSKEFMPPVVATWIGQMVSKAITGTWPIPFTEAAKLLDQLFKNYYGLK